MDALMDPAETTRWLPVREQLLAVSHRRRILQWGAMGATIGTAAVAAWLAVLAADVMWTFAVPQRLVVIGCALAAAVWSVRRAAVPLQLRPESLSEMALVVERQHGLPSDLVAALQFAGEKSGAGSVALRQAVIEQAATWGATAPWEQACDPTLFRRRAKLAGIAASVALLVTLASPAHTRIFLGRLALSDQHYPGNTLLTRIQIGGDTVWDSHVRSHRPRATWGAQGRPLEFRIEAEVRPPEEGVIVCRSTRGGVARELPLRKAANSVAYVAELPRMAEEFTYQVFLGDAWTEAAVVQLREPPVVELSVQVTPPEYARGATPPTGTSTHLAVLEGSQVALTLRSQPDRPLRSAALRCEVGETRQTHELVPVVGTPNAWQLPPETPLARVEREVRYSLQVVDHYGLGLDSPLQGVIRIQPDQAPTATAAVVHRVVLPQAQPVIEFRVQDDFGIQSLALHGQIERAAVEASQQDPNGPTSEVPQAAAPSSTPEAPPSDPAEVAAELLAVPLPLPQTPLGREQLPYRGQWKFDLTPHRLVKGDRIRLSLVAHDFRGSQEGKRVVSEPLDLEISDEAGVLTAITEADLQTEKRLGDVIQQQRHVGGTP